MSRAASAQAQKTYKQANQLEGQSLANSNALYNELNPAFTNEAVNPTGFNQKEMADMTTAGEQSAGGSLGAATGKAQQYAAANRNSGSFTPTLDESARQASKNLSNTTLGIQNENAKLKETQRQAGLEGLQGLDTQQNADVLGSIGLENQSTNALTDAQKAGWVQDFAAIMNSLKGAGFSSSSGGQGGGSSWAVTA